MTAIFAAIRRSGLLKSDIDYHLLRASMLVIFAFKQDLGRVVESRGS